MTPQVREALELAATAYDRLQEMYAQQDAKKKAGTGVGSIHRDAYESWVEDLQAKALAALQALESPVPEDLVVLYQPDLRKWFQAQGEAPVDDIRRARHYPRAEAEEVVARAKRNDVVVLIQEVPGTDNVPAVTAQRHGFGRGV